MNPTREPTAAQVERFRSALSRRLGMRFEDATLPALGDLFHRRLETTEARAEPYLALLEITGAAREELRTLARELTVTETYFFRNVDQFHAVRDVALPARAQAHAQLPAAPMRRLRILSAGCASGEEAYSLAILLHERAESLRGLENLDRCEILAIDINPAALARAAQGRYAPWSFRETPPELRERYFQPAGRDMVIAGYLRDSVKFMERNLIEPDDTFWMPGVFDIVFCRNVIMYFPIEVQRAVIARITRSLAPGGFLFLGHAETMRGLSQEFRLCHTHGTFYYQRRDGETSDDRGLGMNDATTDRFSSAGPLYAPGPIPAPSYASPGGAGLSLSLQAFAPATPALATVSWFETIQRASERVASLSAGRAALSAVARARPSEEAPPPAPAAPPVARAVPSSAWDLTSTVELIGQERYDEARATLLAAPPGAAETADALLVRAVLLTNGGDLGAAETVCARVLELDQLSAGAHYLSALCREHAGDRRGAVDHDQVATYLDPGFAMPRLHLGLLARRAGELDGARRSLTDALGLLEREDPARLLLFAGGFGRAALIDLCRAELAACGAGGRTP